ncbi:MAG: hypothetical protein LUB61_06155 [Eggerthellaceae bacterium]|nr:hypothetical protein [Eggerthellaceae bacterium]
MFDTGISRRVHAAFETLPSIIIPGDISSPLNYFSHDITEPLYEVVNGQVTLNPDGYAAGIGCELNADGFIPVVEEVLTF